MGEARTSFALHFEEQGSGVDNNAVNETLIEQNATSTDHGTNQEGQPSGLNPLTGQNPLHPKAEAKDSTNKFENNVDQQLQQQQQQFESSMEIESEQQNEMPNQLVNDNQPPINEKGMLNSESTNVVNISHESHLQTSSTKELKQDHQHNDVSDLVSSTNLINRIDHQIKQEIVDSTTDQDKTRPLEIEKVNLVMKSNFLEQTLRSNDRINSIQGSTLIDNNNIYSKVDKPEASLMTNVNYVQLIKTETTNQQQQSSGAKPAEQVILNEKIDMDNRLSQNESVPKVSPLSFS